MQIVRHKFNGGLVGDSQRWQSDLEQYQFSLVQSSNTLPTPYGDIKRRPPLVSIGTLSSITVDSVVYYPSDARAFDFVYSAALRYIAVFVVYSADGEDDITRIVVQDTTGTQKGVVSVPYTQLEVLELDVHHTNDVMYIAHQNHYPATLVRNSDANWTFVDHNIGGGPFLDENEEQDSKMNVGLSIWRDDVDYLTGDTVLPSASTLGTVSWIGTAYSMVKNSSIVSDSPTSATYGAIATWETEFGGYIAYDDLNFCSRAHSQSGLIYRFYPYAYARVDKAFSASVIVGDSISIVLDYVEEGGDDNYIDNGTISEILTGTAYDYLKIDFEWSSWTLNYYFEITTPEPDIPEAEKAYWQSFADLNYGGDTSKINFWHFLVGSDDNGGAFITATAGNIAKGVSSATAYTARVQHIDIEPGVDAGWADYWDVESSPTESSFVQINATGVTPFGSTDAERLIYVDKAEEYAQSGVYTIATTSDSFFAIGRVRLITAGGWSGQMALETSANNGADWTKEGNIYSVDNSHNGTIEIDIEKRDVLVRVRAVTLTSGSCQWRVEFPDGYSSIYQIAKYISDNQVLARVVTGTETFFQSSKWALGAFGGANGYPGTATVYENRLWLSGSIGEPFKHWGSVVDKYWNFAIGTFATSAIIFQARADSSTRISWTEPKDNLFFGTDFGEYSAVNLNQSVALSAANPPKVERHTSEGSARIPALVVGSAIAFVSADKKKLKLMRYDALEQDGYRSYDMCFLNPEIAGSGFLGMCLQRSPYPIIWLWTADGTAAAFMIDRENGVVGWSEHSTVDGLIKSLCVIPDEDGIDEVYAVVEREDTVVNASGTCSPDVTGLYPVEKVTVGGAGSDEDIGYVNGDYYFAPDQYPYFQSSPYNTVKLKNNFGAIVHIWLSGTWNLTSSSPVDGYERYGFVFTNSDTGYHIPESGWALGPDLTSGTPPSITYNGMFRRDDDLYYWGLHATGFAVYRVSDDVALFESATLYGTYTPVSGSGATGSVEINALNYHIEKLDYTETEYTDNLNGASEEIITSIFEPTPLSRGPNFLEGNMKFRSERGFVYVVKSNGGEISVDGGATWHDLDYSDLTADGDGLYTGKVVFRANSGYVDYSTIQVRTTGTEELRVSAIRLDIKKHERGGA